MTEIILASHGPLSEGIYQTGLMFYGSIEGVTCLTLTGDKGFEVFKQELCKICEGLKSEQSVIILCDLQGGTPYNISLALSFDERFQSRIKVVAGMNLPMYLATLEARETMSVSQLAEYAAESGRSGVVMAGMDIANDL